MNTNKSIYLNDKKFEYVGLFCVDSSTCWIGDPCYIFGDNADYKPQSWYDVCKEINGQITQMKFNGGSIGLGLISFTGCGDGTYSVYAHKIDGTIAGLFIDFLGVFEDEE